MHTRVLTYSLKNTARKMCCISASPAISHKGIFHIHGVCFQRTVRQIKAQPGQIFPHIFGGMESEKLEEIPMGLHIDQV